MVGTSDDSISPTGTGFRRGKKKDLYPRHGCLGKGLVDRLSAPVPGLSTVLTDSGSVFSRTDNYSPLLDRNVFFFNLIVKRKA